MLIYEETIHTPFDVYQNRRYKGFTKYRLGMEIPMRKDCLTYLVITAAEGQPQLWVVQKSDECDGFVGMRTYFCDKYSTNGDHPCHVIPLDGSAARFSHLGSPNP